VTKILPLSEVKTQFTKIIEGVQDRQDEILVTKNGKPAAVLLSHEYYESLKATLEVLSDPKMMAQIRASEKFYARGGKGKSIEEVFGPEE